MIVDRISQSFKQKYLQIIFTVFVTSRWPLHSWYLYMIFVTSDLGITLTDSHLCHNLTDLQSIPFRSTSNSVVLILAFSLLTIFLQNSSPFWCDLSNSISNSLGVRSWVDFRWWTSSIIFLMLSSMPSTVALISLG